MSAYALMADGDCHAPDAHEVSSAEALTVTAIQPMRLTLVAAPGLLWIAGTRSLLIGRLFDRTSFQPVLDAAGLDHAIAAGLEQFVRDYWGDYVLIAQEAGTLLAFRDPSGGMPCYYGACGRGTFLVSDARIALELKLIEKPAVDAAFIRHWLQYPFLRVPRTGIKGVSELTPGAAITFPLPANERQLWIPADHCEAAHWDMGEAASELRRLILKCVPRAAGDEPALLALSGGLDSSILAGALASTGRRIHAVSFATLSADGDEQAYAAAIAGHLGLELEIIRESEESAIAAASPSFRPGADILLEGVDEAVEAVRLRTGAAVKLDGGGGDSVFGFSATTGPVLDALRAGRVWETMLSVAERSDATLWRVAWYALKKALRRNEIWSEDQTFLEPDALLSGPDKHPWMEGLGRLSPGKREHVVSLISIQHFLDRHSIGGIHRHPLLAQPLLEYCLSVPSWLWNAEGRDRAVARAAFKEMLPRAITDRRTKGSLEGYFQRRFRALLPQLRELLLDGELARDQVIDRKAVEATLAHGDETASDMRMRLSEIATVERWLGAWRSVSSSG
jgi:asparagine synthase (glutamine-hydrolysing)